MKMHAAVALSIIACAGIGAVGSPAVAASFGFDTFDEQAFTLIGSVHVHNAGKAPVDGIEIQAYLPRNQVGQTIFGLDFIPKPAAVDEDRWVQKSARWRIPRLEPGQHVFALWIARAACAEVKFDLEPLRRGGFTTPLSVRSTYLPGDQPALDTARTYFDRVQDLAAYVRKTLSQDRSGLPFPQAIARPESPRLLAEELTRLCHANAIPCRTIGGYARTSGSDFSIDTTGGWWNEIYFAQSGWVPVPVADPRELGRRHNDCIVVKNAGHDPAASDEYWGSVRGAGGRALGDGLRVIHRGYFSQSRRPQPEADLVAAFQKAGDAAQIVAVVSQQGPAAGSLAIGLLEPYLYHPDPKVVAFAAAAVGGTRQAQAAIMLIDAMGRSPEADKLLAAQAESLTGRTFTNPKDWHDWAKTKF